MSGVELIAAERERQIEKEGFGFEHDDTYTANELAIVASLYAIPPFQRVHDDFYDESAPISRVPDGWPETWHPFWWKPTPNDRVRELVKAGALIAAEIDRLQRELAERKERQS